MSVRTTIKLVKSVTDTELTNIQIIALIEQSNRIVTRLLSGEGMADDLLADIETWYTAHLIAVGWERQLKSEKVDDMWLTYQGKFGAFLESTTFGQMVLSLDSSGLFSNSTP